MGAISLRELKQGFIQLLFPRLCEGCNQPLLQLEEVLCIGCAPLLPETSFHDIEDNDAALLFAGRVPYIKATSMAYFTAEGLLQHLLHELKYRGQKEIAHYLGARFATSLQACNWTNGIDMIIPVPLHSKRQKERGYNQSMLIAEAMGAVCGIGVEDKVIGRARNTESQTKKTRTERAANMDGAFTLRNNQIIKGKHILIVDDVLTTGATIEAVATALLGVENVKISIATVGIAVS